MAPTTRANGLKDSQSIVTSIPDVPVTVQFPVPQDLDSVIKQPGLPRANRAVTRDKPEGSPESKNNRTVLQGHVDFWDRNHVGKIFPWDTYIGFRRIGFGYLISFFAVPFLHGSFSYPSSPSWIPDPRLPIFTNRIHRCKHGSDSETYDTEGRFVPEKYEEIFSKFDKGNKGGLSWSDIKTLMVENSNIMDPTGWIAERLEWWATYVLLRDHRGLVTRERIRAMFDGTLWDTLAKEVEAKRQGRRWEWEYLGIKTQPVIKHEKLT